MKTVKEVSNLAGISVRTLHYYDQIGLLHPATVTESGYRLYGAQQLQRLQQILFLRELRFPLKEIGQILSNPTFEPHEALQKHRQLLVLQRDRLNTLIGLMDQTMKGEITMSLNALNHAPLEETREKYAAEVRERWGNTDAYLQSEERARHYSKNDWHQMQAGMEDIFRAFAALAAQKADPACQAAQDLTSRWQRYINEHFYDCSPEILAGLGEMYLQDARFTESLNQYGEGRASFVSNAIRIFCQTA
ncbi:MAG: MerR family transcriptional regulator [Oscillospiraceae bacterium]|nr:MerR family transcriptional regulator [Oscillospiraceae bacterium]